MRPKDNVGLHAAYARRQILGKPLKFLPCMRVRRSVIHFSCGVPPISVCRMFVPGAGRRKVVEEHVRVLGLRSGGEHCKVRVNL
jgi:hypothetical protein